MARILTFSALAIFVVASYANAQTSTGTAASGQLSSSTSSASFGSTAFGNSNFGKTGATLSAADFGGAGSGNLMRGALNQAGMIGGMNTAMGMQMGMMGMGGMGGFGRMGGFGGMNGMQGMMNQGQNRNNARANLKFPTKLGFSVPATTIATRAVQFESRLRRLPGVASSKNVTVTVDGQVAILEGQVTSEHERSIIERLAMMEPGISAVRNQLEVSPDLANLDLSAPANLPPPTK